MTLAETAKWLKTNVNPIEGYPAAKLKAQHCGVTVYPRAWGAAFGTKKPTTKKPTTKKPTTKKPTTKRAYSRLEEAAPRTKSSPFTLVIESALGRSVMSFSGAHISLDTGENTLTVKQSD